jgi:NAD kinase
MKFAIVGKNGKVVEEYKKILLKDHNAYSKKPDIVISLGGDGTLLLSERLYPSIPKIPIRDKSICMVCNWNSLYPILKRLEKEKYKIKEYSKLESFVKGKRLLCANDFVFRNKNPYEAVRFDVYINAKKTSHIGDGVVISTAFGSSAYFYSITKKNFKSGIGIAFNNIRDRLRYKILKDGKITIKVTRGKATFSCDNSKDIIQLKEKDTFTVRKSKMKMRIIKFR